MLFPGYEWVFIALATFDRMSCAAVWSQSRSDWWRINRLLVAGSWSATAVLGSDDFDPVAPLSLSFVAPIGEAMTYVLLASGLEPSFNVTLVLGVLVGAFIFRSCGASFSYRLLNRPATTHVIFWCDPDGYRRFSTRRNTGRQSRGWRQGLPGRFSRQL